MFLFQTKFEVVFKPEYEQMMKTLKDPKASYKTKADAIELGGYSVLRKALDGNVYFGEARGKVDLFKGTMSCNLIGLNSNDAAKAILNIQNAINEPLKYIGYEAFVQTASNKQGKLDVVFTITSDVEKKTNSKTAAIISREKIKENDFVLLYMAKTGGKTLSARVGLEYKNANEFTGRAQDRDEYRPVIAQFKGFAANGNLLFNVGGEWDMRSNLSNGEIGEMYKLNGTTVVINDKEKMTVSGGKLPVIGTDVLLGTDNNGKKKEVSINNIKGIQIE